MEIDARPKMIGARVQRLEDPRLLAGQGRFIDDLNLPRMLHIAFVRSDHAKYSRGGKLSGRSVSHRPVASRTG